MSLEKLRLEIDNIDSRLLELLNERAQKVLEIASEKQTEGRSYYDPSREKRILQQLSLMNKGPLPT